MKKITSQSNIFIIVPTAGAILFATSSLFASGTIVGIGAGQVNSPPNPPNYGQGASQNGVNFIDVFAGDNHSLAIKSDGSFLPVCSSCRNLWSLPCIMSAFCSSSAVLHNTSNAKPGIMSNME